MFDIGFLELAIIAVIALLVVGPEKLPGLARTAGIWVGRARRFISQVKTDIDKEINVAEIKRSIEEHTNLEEIQDVKDVMKDTQAALEEEVMLDSQSETTIEQPKDEDSSTNALATNKVDHQNTPTVAGDDKEK